MFSPQTKYKPLRLKIRDEERVDEETLTPGALSQTLTYVK